MELIKVDSLEAVPPSVERRRSNECLVFPLGAFCFWSGLGCGGLGRLRLGQALAFQCLDSLVIEDRGREALINQCVGVLLWIIGEGPRKKNLGQQVGFTCFHWYFSFDPWVRSIIITYHHFRAHTSTYLNGITTYTIGCCRTRSNTYWIESGVRIP